MILCDKHEQNQIKKRLTLTENVIDDVFVLLYSKIYRSVFPSPSN